MELRLLAAALRRHLVFLALTTLVCLAVTTQVLAGQASRYVATATLLLDPLAVTVPLGQPFTGDPERYIGGEIRILESQDVAESAARLVPGYDAPSLRRSVSLTHTVGSDLVDVTAEADEAEEAQALANAVATTYVERRAAQTSERVAAVVQQANKDVAAIEGPLRALRGTGPSIDAQRQTLLSQYQQALDRRREITAPSATRDGTRVVDEAELPQQSQGLPRIPTLLAGAAVGALLGLGVALLLEALRPRVIGRRQLERLVASPVLTAFRRVRRRRGGRAVEGLLPTARTLATLVALSPHEGKRLVIAVCSVTAGAGTTTVADALALSLAEQGSSVVVVQGKAARTAAPPGDARSRPAAKSSGGRAEPRLVLSEHPSISTLPWVGARPPRAEDLAALVEGLPPVHDAVVLDLPPVLESPVASGVCAWVRDIVMIVRVPDELERETELAHEMLTSTRDDLRLFVVTNEPPQPRSRRTAGRLSTQRALAARSA